MHGMVFHIQRFSLFDGPGVRTVVFLKGCPLRCEWCHNPEGLHRYPEILYNPAQCIGCGACVSACPNGRHMLDAAGHRFNRTDCVGCGVCADVCCTKALALAGCGMTVEEVMAEVMRDLTIYRESGGGMTLSGGEPLYQPDFAVSLLKAAKAQGISTCLETCGQADTGVILKAAAYTDVFYFDYKATGDGMHRALCGVPQGKILQNLALLDRPGAVVILRCPLVPGVNDTPVHINGIVETAKKYNCIKEIHLEPYHRLGVSKAGKLGLPTPYDAQPPDRERIEAYAKEIAEASGKKCIVS